MHHWQALAKHVQAREPTSLENPAAPLRFEKGEPQQHHDLGTEIERVRDELLRKFERRIRYDGFDAIGQFVFEEEIAPAEMCGVAVTTR
jgi:hypothetical protein